MTPSEVSLSSVAGIITRFPGLHGQSPIGWKIDRTVLAAGSVTSAVSTAHACWMGFGSPQ